MPVIKSHFSFFLSGRSSVCPLPSDSAGGHSQGLLSGETFLKELRMPKMGTREALHTHM